MNRNNHELEKYIKLCSSNETPTASPIDICIVTNEYEKLRKCLRQYLDIRIKTYHFGGMQRGPILKYNVIEPLGPHTYNRPPFDRRLKGIQ